LQGVALGMFYKLDDGRCLYLSWQTGARAKALLFKRNAWCMDVDTLRLAELYGCAAVGIVHRVNGVVSYYITNLNDFWNPPSEIYTGGKTVQRLLGREKFLVNTSLSVSQIGRSMNIR
jgi:hypothetical protein